MNPARAGWHTLAIFAILFLLGFGFVVYAVPGVANPSPMSSSSSAPAASPAQGENVYYRLVQVATTARGANASGYAGISISGQSLSIEWSVTNAPPGEQLQLVMAAVAASATGASKSFTFATVEVNPQGEAGSTASATLEPGNYSIGLTVVDPSTSSRSTVFTSDPSSAQVVISPTQTTSTQSTLTTTAPLNGLSYSLVPLPVYQGQAVPTNYSFREGGALIVASGDQLRVTTSFLGEPNTKFFNVVQTANQNFTVGSVTTTSSGGGVFKGNITLASGTYDIGLLLFVYGNTASPVAVSMPRAIRVTLPVTTETSSTTTTTGRELVQQLHKHRSGLDQPHHDDEHPFAPLVRNDRPAAVRTRHDFRGPQRVSLRQGKRGVRDNGRQHLLQPPLQRAEPGHELLASPVGQRDLPDDR